ncbi:hypothetical protein BDQ17DRAFT_302597 [Cyathus striatus]|nr:hypothetical protein BDQ17DRAFT_302597 [Cyathus striatus]
MSVGRPTSSIVFSPEAYEANRARIEAAKAVIQAAELENEEGRKNHEQMEAELRAKIQEGDEARRALAQLEASRKHLATQNTPALVPSPAITVPLGNDATESADTSRIEEIHSHDATYSTAPQIQTSWSGSVAQNGSYTTNNVASYSAQSSSNTHVASHSSTAGYRGGNPYAVLSSNPLSQTPVQHVARHHYGSVHQPYSQAQYQGSSRNYQYNYSQPESQSMHSSHYASVIPLSNQETEQSARHYSGSTHHYNSQQSQQYLNKSHEVTGTAHPSVLAAATAIGRQRMYQPPSGSSSLEGALTPAGQSNVQVAPHHTTGNNKQSQAPSSTLNPSSSNTLHQTELSNSLHIQPTSGASQVSSSYTAAALNHYSTSSQSSRPPLTTLLEKVRDYVRRFANDWDITAKPNSFTIIPQLPSYKLYKVMI